MKIKQLPLSIENWLKRIASGRRMLTRRRRRSLPERAATKTPMTDRDLDKLMRYFRLREETGEKKGKTSGEDNANEGGGGFRESRRRGRAKK
jgi:hypothetical protein